MAENGVTEKVVATLNINIISISASKDVEHQII